MVVQFLRRVCSLFTVFAGVFTAPVLASEQLPAAIVFGGDLAYPPFEWIKDGRPTGFNIDLADALAEVGGKISEHRLGDWPDIIRALEAGEVDVVPMLISEERQKTFSFTSAFHYISHAIYAKPTETAIAVEGLAGFSVAVEHSSYAHNRLQLEVAGASLQDTDNTLEALHAVAEGRARYAVLAIPAADRLIQIKGLDVRRIGPPFWSQGYAFAVRADREDLAKWLDQSLALAIGTGRYEDVYERWMDRLQPADFSIDRVLFISAIIAAGLLVLIAIGFGWSISLRRVVGARTAALNEELARNEKAKADIKYLADHDADTGLAKHHHFVRLVDEYLQKPLNDRRLELTVLKLVGIDAIISTFGYQVSRSFVDAFSGRIAGSGFYVAGYFGRGVFALLAPKNAVCEQINSLSTHLYAGELVLYPQLMMGAAYWPDHGDNATELVRQAETALASSVAQSRSRTVYDPSIEPDQRDLEIVGAFRETNGAALQAFLQPQVDLRTGEIVAAEALVRWYRPDSGFLSPAKFVPLLERAGLVGQVTAYMIDEAARIAAEFRRLVRPCAISVNVSANDLLSTDLCAIVAAAVERHGTEPGDIKLELTETSAIADPEQVRNVLEALKTMGISTSIDDFGTGHSSLVYLSTFPVSQVKIDQIFVSDIALNARNNSIVRSTVAVAQELGLKTVAEGAEDVDTVVALKEIGCDLVQGYVVSKPLPEDDFYRFVRQYRAPAYLAPQR